MREQMWRAVALFRVVTLAYTAVIIIRDHDRYAYPAAGLGALAIMTGWTVLSIVAYARPVGRRPWLIAADAIQARLGKYQQTAVLTCPSLADKKITPHVLRHTRAMRMRAAGHDISMIALWLGHEDISSTQKYLHADLMTKERALDRATADGTPPGRYQPTDAMLDFLDKLTGSS